MVAVLTGLGSFTTGTFNFGAGVVLGIIGIIITIVLLLLIQGYSLDIVKFGIERRSDAPGIDFVRQISNGIKCFVVVIAYMIIPIIIMVVLGVIFRQWIAAILGGIIAIIFAFALVVAISRLAKTDSLGDALSIGEVIRDLQEIGVGKVIVTLIVATILGLVIVFLLSFVLAIFLSFTSGDIVTNVVTIVSAILDAWLLFYENRVIGLLHS